MRLLKIVAVLLSIFVPATSSADDAVVVELFTSQGCSSCPPADALLKELEGVESVIVLGWHVDYWDYLGWKDIFSHPESTKRQARYRNRFNLRSLFTPQLVVQGTESVVGADERKVRMYLDQFRDNKSRIVFEQTEAQSGAEVRLFSSAPQSSSDVWLIRIIPLESTAIERGENAGKSIEYVNIVRELTHVAGWNGRSALDLSLKLDGEDRYVLLVQEKGAGQILGAKYLR